jgi:hypothetical protein
VADDSDRERQIAAILDGARRARPKPSRALWWIAGVIAAICVVGFVAMMLVDVNADPASPVPERVRDTHTGFASGLAIGLGVGIAIGFVIARYRSSRSTDHSSRNTP